MVSRKILITFLSGQLLDTFTICYYFILKNAKSTRCLEISHIPTIIIINWGGINQYKF